MCNVRDVLRDKSPEVWTIGPRDLAYKALELMAAKNVGALLVVDPENRNKVLGIFSERDYARKVILQGKSSHATPVSDLMSSPVTVVTPSDSIDTCMQLMTGRHIRHLPVLENGRLVGIISIGDVVKAVIADKDVMIRDLENFIVGARS
jgi:CBS domain-containing protein